MNSPALTYDIGRAHFLAVQTGFSTANQIRKSVEREGDREDGEAAGTNGRVLQEEGRVEEAPHAQQAAPPRHSRPRYRRRRLQHLPRRRSRLQQAIRSFPF